MPSRVKARFIDPMLLPRTNGLPADASRWEYRLKLDGYRCIALSGENNSVSTSPGLGEGVALAPDGVEPPS
jgi:ATP-dependent DNA ligase